MDEPPPRTPRKRKRESSTLHESPYFSPTKRQRSPNNSIDRSSPEPVEIETTTKEDRDELPDDDPLSLFYARSFEKLYEELKDLKPNLIQEEVAGDPRKVLVACMLLNKTAGKLALPVFRDMMERWPRPWDMSQADEDVLVSMLLRLGTYTIRAKRLISLSREYLKDPPSSFDARPSRAATPFGSPDKRPERYPATPISHLPGAGPYALDSYRIFCTMHDDPVSNEWKQVLPSDKELGRYLRWKWAIEEHREWSPTDGPGPPASLSYLKSLISHLSSPQFGTRNNMPPVPSTPRKATAKTPPST